MMDRLDLIKKLTALPGVSGREEAVREEILRLLPAGCDCRVDALGNLLVRRGDAPADGPHILLTAHMDEVGLIVTHIGEDGMLRFATVGGIDSRVLAGRRVFVGDRLLPASIGIRAIHQQKSAERTAAPDPDSLYLDIGAHTAEEAAAQVRLGDRAVFAHNFTPFGTGLVRAKALDDRIGCVLLLELLQQPLPVNLTCAFTVQEETGCTGGKTAAAAVGAEIALVLETTTAADIAGVDARSRVCRLGGGAAISFMDRGAIYDSALYRLALETAREENIPVQVKAAVSGGNESRTVQTAGQGARTLAVSVPCRYLHSPATVASLADVESTLALLRALLPRLGAAL